MTGRPALISIFDYAVATKGFTFWLDYSVPAEKTVFESVCQQGNYIPELSTVMGYYLHGDYLLDILCIYGIGYVVNDFYRNGSFWSSLPNHTYTQDSGKAFTPQPGKIYASKILSDGLLVNNPTKVVYLKFSDGSPSDGTGQSLWHIKIK